MPPFAPLFTFLVYLPLRVLTEGLPVFTELCRHDQPELVHLCRTKRAWIAGLAQPSHSAQLGDPCTEPGDCRVPNSECIPTDNLYWNRQNFCVCQPGFHPSTGFCVADTGGDAQGMVKLEQPGQQQLPTAVTESAAGDDSKNTSSRSIVITPVPGQDLLQGFHFGNRTQSIVSNIVEQLTQLRGPQQTEHMKQKLEHMGLPLLQPPSSFTGDPSEEAVSTGPPIIASSADPTGGTSVEPTSAGTASTMAPASSLPTTSPTPSSSGSTAGPTIGTTVATAPAPFGSHFPVPDSQVLPPMPVMASAAPLAPGASPTPVPTMATLATLKSSSNNGSPFLPPALPPFFTKHTTTRTTTSTTTTTMMAPNITTSTMATTPGQDDPESRLALLKKVQNLIDGTSAPTLTLPDPAQESAPGPTAPLKVHASFTPHGAGATKANNASASTAAPNTASSPRGDTGQGGPPMSRAGLPKPHHVHHPAAPPAMKQASNTFSIPKMPPMVPMAGGGAGLPPAPVPSYSSPSPMNPNSPEPQNQVRSTVVDHTPGVDFYAVFRSAAENVIREYLGGIMTSTVSPGGSPQVPQPHSEGPSDHNVEKMFQKFMQSKTGAAAVLAAAGQSGLRPPSPGAGPKAGLGPPHAPTIPHRFIQPKTSAATTVPPATSTAKPTNAGPAGGVTRPRHPFIWRSTTPGQASARPLPRIVFTG